MDRTHPLRVLTAMRIMDSFFKIATCVLIASAIGPGQGRAQSGAPVEAQGLVDQPCPPPITPPPAFIAFAKGSIDETLANPPPGRDGDPTVAAYAQALAARAGSDWPALCQYQMENAAIVSGEKPHPETVFIGDSITYNWILADPDVFSNGKIVDRGISGQTTPQMLLRFYADVVSLRPNIVHIMAGTNDIAGSTGPTSYEGIQNNIMAMVDIAKMHQIRVVLASIPPSANFGWRPSVKPAYKIMKMNNWLRDYAKAKGLTYVDYYSVLATPSGAMQPALSRDGVHPFRVGYRLMRPLMESALAQAARQN